MLPPPIDHLQRMPIFGALHDAALDFLLARARSMSVPAGDLFFREGEAADGMFVLLAGRVAVSREWQGRDVVLRELSGGDCFGEMALMDLHPRSASVRAIDDCVAIHVRPDDLYALYQHDCAQFALLQMNMGREVCRRLRTTDEALFRVLLATAATPTTPT